MEKSSFCLSSPISPPLTFDSATPTHCSLQLVCRSTARATSLPHVPFDFHRSSLTAARRFYLARNRKSDRFSQPMDSQFRLSSLNTPATTLGLYLLSAIHTSSPAKPPKKMILKFSLFLTIIFFAWPTIVLPSKSHLIFWNVGQGSWATFSSKEKCLHFDMGGEFAPIEKVKRACLQKANLIFFSHWDWDHISFTQKISSWPRVCIARSPGGKPSYRKKRKLTKIKKCFDKVSLVEEISFRAKRKTPNENSRIFVFAKTLFPGDSTVQMEALWAKKLHPLKIKNLAVGHHGSQTSTSSFLLKKLPELQQAIVSSRFKRFRHPHKKVISRLRSNRIAILRTEDWGNIFIENALVAWPSEVSSSREP